MSSTRHVEQRERDASPDWSEDALNFMCSQYEALKDYYITTKQASHERASLHLTLIAGALALVATTPLVTGLRAEALYALGFGLVLGILVLGIYTYRALSFFKWLEIWLASELDSMTLRWTYHGYEDAAHFLLPRLVGWARQRKVEGVTEPTRTAYKPVLSDVVRVNGGKVVARSGLIGSAFRGMWRAGKYVLKMLWVIALWHFTLAHQEPYIFLLTFINSASASALMLLLADYPIPLLVHMPAFLSRLVSNSAPYLDWPVIGPFFVV